MKNYNRAQRNIDRMNDHYTPREQAIDTASVADDFYEVTYGPRWFKEHVVPRDTGNPNWSLSNERQGYFHFPENTWVFIEVEKNGHCEVLGWLWGEEMQVAWDNPVRVEPGFRIFNPDYLRPMSEWKKPDYPIVRWNRLKVNNG